MAKPMVLVQKCYFSNFFFQAIQARNVSFTIFQYEKTTSQGIKTRRSKKRKIDIVPKGLTHPFGPKIAIFLTFIFQVIEARNMSFTIFQNEKKALQAVKTRSSKSRKLTFFKRGYVPPLYQKTECIHSVFHPQF